MLRAVFVLLVAVALGWSAEPALSPGHEHFYNLEYEQAYRYFSQQAAAHPDDPGARNHVAMAILFRELYRVGALESEMVTGNNSFLRRPKLQPTPEDQRLFHDHIASAIRLAQQRLTQHPNDVRALYEQGVAYALRANYNYLVRKAWIDALKDATTGRKLHQQALQIDPKFVDARLVPAIHDYLLGSLPLTYKMLGFLAGARGDREAGIRAFKEIAATNAASRYDAQIFLAALYRREKRPREAVPLLHELIRRFPRNYLLRLELAQMYSDLGDKQDALGSLAQVEELKRRGSPGLAQLPPAKLAYSRGNIQFWYNDIDPALENMKRATAEADQLDLNTGVLAWMRLGQLYDMKGRRGEAISAYRKAVEYAPNSEAARESRGYMDSPFRRKS